VKNTLVSIGLLTVFGFTLFTLPAFSQNNNEAREGTAPTPPAYCNPCLFYGGDFDANNSDSNVLSNGYLKESETATYVPFYVPPGQTWTIGGLFSNNMSTISFLDPSEIRWSISSGISGGNAGTVIASGESPATWTPTGRTWENGYFTEYTALAHLKPEQFVTLTTGVYWIAAVPVCTDSDCGNADFYLSDVEDVPAPNHKGVQPNDDSYYVWDGAGYFFAETGGPSGICGGGCDKFSFGILGHATASE
jgi:hypothetical protein